MFIIAIAAGSWMYTLSDLTKLYTILKSPLPFSLSYSSEDTMSSFLQLLNVCSCILLF